MDRAVFLIITIVLLLFIVNLTISFFIAFKTVYPKKFSIKNIVKSIVQQSKSENKYEKVTFTMDDDYIINGEILLNGKKPFVIISHGYTSNKNNVRKYADMFYELGYSCLIYDLRGQGSNESHDISIGYKEAKDLVKIIVKMQKHNYKVSGLFGVSMGAVTSLLSLQYNPDIQFVIADSSFGYVKTTFKSSLKQLHIPSFTFLPFINLYLKLFNGFGFKDINPSEIIDYTMVPIMFIANTKDTIINNKEIEDMYHKSKNDKSRLVIYESNHCGGFDDNPKLYKKNIKEFINNIKKRAKK